MFARITLAALFATAAVASPAPAPTSTSPDLSNFTEIPKPVREGDFNLLETEKDCTDPDDTGDLWTVENMARKCNGEDTECTWKYQVNTYKEGTDPYECEYTIKSKDGVPASEVTTYDWDGYECDVFHITQEYYPEKNGNPGYTVLCANYPKDLRRIFAGYDDNEIANGETPVDKTYCVEQPQA